MTERLNGIELNLHLYMCIYIYKGVCIYIHTYLAAAAKSLQS